MRRASKRVLFFVIAAILFFLWLACAGIERRHGDVVNTLVKGIDNIHWGCGLNGCIEFVFQPITKVVPGSEKMKATAAVLQQRLFNRNLIDNKIFVNESNNEIIVQIPLGCAGSNTKELICELKAQSVLTFREGLEVAENGKPRGATLAGILLTREDVDKASVFNLGKDFGVTIKFNEEGKKRFEEATSKVSASGGAISIWLDDNLISAPSVRETITSGKASITGLPTIADAIEFANQINNKELPFNLKLQRARVIEPRFGVAGKKAILVGLLAVGVLSAASLVLFARVAGAIFVLAMMGEFAVFISALTGFFPSSSYLPVTVSVCLGFVLFAILNLGSGFLVLNRIKAALQDGKTAKSAISFGFQKKNATNAGRWALVVGLALIGCFGPPTTLTNRSLNWLYQWLYHSKFVVGFEPLYSLGRLLVAAAASDFLFGALAFKQMLMSLVRFKLFKNPVFYGVNLQHDGQLELRNKEGFLSKVVFWVCGLVISIALCLGVALKLHPSSGWFLNFSYTGSVTKDQVVAVLKAQKNLGCCTEIHKTSDIANGNEGFSILAASAKSESDLNEFMETLRQKFAENNIKETDKGHMTLIENTDALVNFSHLVACGGATFLFASFWDKRRTRRKKKGDSNGA